METELQVIHANLLPAASTVSDADMILIIQGGRPKRALPSAMKGEKGDRGDSVSLRATSTAIQWKIGEEDAWRELFDFSTIRGDIGLTGQGVSYQWSSTALTLGTIDPGETKVVWGDPVELKGEKGDTGSTGQGFAYEWDGTKLKLGIIPVGELSTTWGDPVDLKGETGLTGQGVAYAWDGTKLKLGVIPAGGSDTNWGDLVELKGDRGEQGFQPGFKIGSINTIDPADSASVTITKDGVTTEGGDLYRMDLSLPRGLTGKEGMPRVPSAVLDLTSESTSEAILAAWGGLEAMAGVGKLFLAGDRSVCLMSGNATLYFNYTDDNNFVLDLLFRLNGVERLFEHTVTDGVAAVVVTSYDSVHVSNAAEMVTGKQYAFEPTADGSAAGRMVQVTTFTEDDKAKLDNIDLTHYQKTVDADAKYVAKEEGKGLSSNDYTSDEKAKLADTYTKSEVEELIPTVVDAYSKTESDQKFALISDQPYVIANPSGLFSLTEGTQETSYIDSLLGMSFLTFAGSSSYKKCLFPGYIAKVAHETYFDDSNTLHFAVSFTFLEPDLARLIKIDNAGGGDTCEVTVTDRQLLTNIVSISSADYASLSSPDSGTLYLIQS